MAKTKDQKLNQIIGVLKQAFSPSQIFLFGSRANGTSHPRSDYDLFLIVENSELTQIQRMQLAHRALFDLHAPIDVFIYTRKEFEELKDDFGSIPNTVATEGLELQVG